MKILFCIGSMNKGGAERVIANLANFLIKENEVGIAITINDTPKYELNKDIKFFTLDKKIECSNNIIFRNIKRIKSLKNIIATFNPNIIISFLPEPSYRVLLLRRLNKIPVIVSVRNDPKIEYKSKLSKLIMKLLYPIADGFVFQTTEAKEYFCKRIQEKSIIIPNPLKEEFVQRPIYSGEREKKIITVGRLEKQKNHRLLIEAYKDIANKIEEYKLMIYGEGSLRQELENQIKDLNLKDKVILAGEVNDIPNKLEKSSLFVLTSNFEGMPNALMEAMALGVPCISTDCPCGGPNFLIKNNENGLLVKTNDKNELEDKILNVLYDKELRDKIGNNARKIRKLLDPKVINKKWYKYIEKIAKK